MIANHFHQINICWYDFFIQMNCASHSLNLFAFFLQFSVYFRAFVHTINYYARNLMFNDFNSSIQWIIMSKLTTSPQNSIQSNHVLYSHVYATRHTPIALQQTMFWPKKSKIRCVRLIMKIKMQNHHREKKCVGQPNQQMFTSLRVCTRKKWKPVKFMNMNK